MSFLHLGLSDHVLQGILASGYSTPTPIQEQAIPIAIGGRDIIGCAQTGTGKTAAFVVPLLHQLSISKGDHRKKVIKGLVLTPTRELAKQVEEAVSTYGRFTSRASATVYGGVNIDNQIKQLRRGVDVVVATPGRLIDLINRRSIDLSHVGYLVIDEADRMFDMGFIQDVRRIIARLPAERQTLLFSATMPKEIRELSASTQNNPHFIEVGVQHRPVETVKQAFYSVSHDSKMDLLLHLIKTHPMESTLIFTRTKHGADKVSRRLEKNNLTSVSIHSDRTQAQRDRALSGFKQGRYEILVATDVASRGIDVDGISHVLNYDTPQTPDAYIHRIGRTGRASATGDAITFVSTDERKYFKSIERFIGKNFRLEHAPAFEKKPEEPKQESPAEKSVPSKQRTGTDRNRSSQKRFRNGKKKQWRQASDHQSATPQILRREHGPAFEKKFVGTNQEPLVVKSVPSKQRMETDRNRSSQSRFGHGKKKQWGQSSNHPTASPPKKKEKTQKIDVYSTSSKQYDWKTLVEVVDRGNKGRKKTNRGSGLETV